MTGFNAVTTTPWGSCVFNRHDRLIGKCLEQYHEFSEDELYTLRAFAPPGSVVLDVGANIGTIAVPLAMHLGTAGAVIAFEPQRLLFQLLCANAALNSVVNIYPVRAAVGDAEGTLALAGFDPTTTSAPGCISITETSTAGAEMVAMMTIDGLDETNLNRVSLIKIDVEGSEALVLNGARKTIERVRPVLYVENDRKEKSADLIDLLVGLKYALYWDLPRLVRAGDGSDLASRCSINMLCLAAEVPQNVYLEPVLGRHDSGALALERYKARGF